MTFKKITNHDHDQHADTSSWTRECQYRTEQWEKIRLEKMQNNTRDFVVLLLMAEQAFICVTSAVP